MFVLIFCRCMLHVVTCKKWTMNWLCTSNLKQNTYGRKSTLYLRGMAYFISCNSMRVMVMVCNATFNNISVISLKKSFGEFQLKMVSPVARISKCTPFLCSKGNLLIQGLTVYIFCISIFGEILRVLNLWIDWHIKFRKIGTPQMTIT